eukprot:1677057-Heterocapsa_arctica.AAC.1
MGTGSSQLASDLRMLPPMAASMAKRPYLPMIQTLGEAARRDLCTALRGLRSRIRGSKLMPRSGRADDGRLLGEAA